MSEGTIIAPQGTCVAPEGTVTAPEGTVTMPAPGTGTKATGLDDGDPALVSSGSEADIYKVQFNGETCAMKLYKDGHAPNKKVFPYLRKLHGKGLIAEVLSTGVKDGREYEIMHWYPCGSAAKYNFKGQSSEILSIILKIALALDKCHKAGIIHKDVKPANILITDDTFWTCELCDFGIADVLTDGKVSTKQARTPIYAAPELYNPKNAVARIDGQDIFQITPAADFYSLGMTAICLWMGEKEFLGKEQDLAVTKLTTGIKAPADMPDNLREIVNGLLEKNPARRFKLEDLANYLGEGEVGEYALRLYTDPLSDPVFNTDMDSPDYLGTPPRIAILFNELYKWFRLDSYPCPIEDRKLAGLILSSFENFEESYMEVFFDGKASVFSEQLDWMRYCCDWESDDNRRKAGPQDGMTRLEISIMKTIRGFGYTPEYTFEDSEETITTLEELHNAKGDRKAALKKGLKGWLAVQFHENPFEDLSEKGRYEELLEQYLDEIHEIDPLADESLRFRQAKNKVLDIYRHQLYVVEKNWKKTRAQTIIGLVLMVPPLLFVAFGAAPALKIGAAIVALLDCIFFFFQKSVFSVGKNELLPPSTEQLRTDPLYYAFNNEKTFNSSIETQLKDSDMEWWKDDIKIRRKRLILMTFITLLYMFIAAGVDAKIDSRNSNVEQTETVEDNGEMQ